MHESLVLALKFRVRKWKALTEEHLGDCLQAVISYTPNCTKHVDDPQCQSTLVTWGYVFPELHICRMEGNNINVQIIIYEVSVHTTARIG